MRQLYMFCLGAGGVLAATLAASCLYLYATADSSTSSTSIPSASVKGGGSSAAVAAAGGGSSTSSPGAAASTSAAAWFSGISAASQGLGMLGAAAGEAAVAAQRAVGETKW